MKDGIVFAFLNRFKYWNQLYSNSKFWGTSDRPRKSFETLIPDQHLERVVVAVVAVVVIVVVVIVVIVVGGGGSIPASQTVIDHVNDKLGTKSCENHVRTFRVFLPRSLLVSLPMGEYHCDQIEITKCL